MTTAITPVSRAEQALAQASTPEEIKKVESMAAAAIAWAKNQEPGIAYELAFPACMVYIGARIKWTADVEQSIERGGDRHSKKFLQGDSTVTLKDYDGLTKMQWSRLKAELAAAPMLGEYESDCVQKGMLPTPHGLRGFGKKIIGDSTSDEWWTPGKYIDSVRTVLGGIDLDPASCEQANRVVKARKIYTASDSGLDHIWRGKVFINPPYSDNKRFAEKLRDEYNGGNVTEAIALLGAHAIETQWFAPYWDHILCFTGHRINFNTPDGPSVAGNINGSVFVHLGNTDKNEKFADEFGKHGYVVKRWP